MPDPVPSRDLYPIHGARERPHMSGSAMIRPVPPREAHMSDIHVTGHRSPDTDSIASAIAYAELKGRIDARNRYIPARLGEVNAQTRWALDRSGAAEPEFLPHAMLRVRDIMQERFPSASAEEPVRSAGLAATRAGLDVVPIVDAAGALTGVLTARSLAQRYVRESQ